MSVLVEKIYKTNPRRIISGLFMVLDKKSEEDRKVVLISESSRTLYAADENEEVRYEGVDNVIWRKHRIPFEKAASFWLLVMGMPGNESDEFLQNTTWKTIDRL